MKKHLLNLALLTIPVLGFGQTFQENFDGNGPGIAAWTIIDVDGRTPAEGVADQGFTGAWISKDKGGPTPNYGGPDGDYAAMSTSWYSPAGASNDWLISPQIVLPAAASVLKWDAKAQDPDYRDGYKVMLSTNGGNTVADFSVQLYSTTGENSTWTSREVPLAAYAGQTVRIAFVNNSNDMYVLLVDNIKVENAPTAPPSCTSIISPANAATGVAANATLSWASVAGASSYDLYMDTNPNPTTLVSNVTGTSYTVTSNLALNTVYYWKIAPRNAAGAATGCTVSSFTTSAIPPYCGPLTFEVDFLGILLDGTEPITLVNFAGINNQTDPDALETPHEMFLDQAASVNPGNSYTITLEGNTNGDYTSKFAVFIDWNQNGTLNDAGEVYEVTQTLTNSTGADGQQVTHSISVPSDAVIGSTRMRVKKIYDDEGEDVSNLLNPCIGASYGQAEDYSVNVSVLAVSEVKKAIKAYPNPVKDIFTIEAQGKIKSVKVFDAAGKQIFTNELNEAKSQIDFSKFNVGVYVVTTTLTDGTTTSTKVIKK